MAASQPDAAEPLRGHPGASIGGSAAARREDGAQPSIPCGVRCRDATALRRGRQRRAALRKRAARFCRGRRPPDTSPCLRRCSVLIGVIQIESAPADARVVLREGPLRGRGVARRHHGGEGRRSLVAVRWYRRSGPGKRRTDGRSLARRDPRSARPSPQKRIRAWVLHNQAASLLHPAEFEAAPGPSCEQALALKEAALGKNHPDVGRTVSALAWVADRAGPSARRRCAIADRALEILHARWIRTASSSRTRSSNRGESAERARAISGRRGVDYLAALRILRAQLGATNFKMAYPVFRALGEGQARARRRRPAPSVTSKRPCSFARAATTPTRSTSRTRSSRWRARSPRAGRIQTRARALAAAAHGCLRQP